MLLDRATCDANHRRFIERVVEKEMVWYLSHPAGVANSVSNDDEETTVLMFWSDRAYATRARSNGFEDYEETSMDLFDFLFRWLPGMSEDGVLAGTNWTGDLIGVECDPFELREEIESEMPVELQQNHKDRYDALNK
ncbi:DUF2750 domain-containing protein [Persicirhabdus sediminis]|uniref:DUF2750 domain-containing protein n=1 Tax=Persicirhabdus sediminis TaxID=454144 RepID=A0A8J7MC05_9BACT|nr:DUF2750 domain-containing protein [Persicirhabdus sediminis]MBK1790206.1 DUF2750 domain-containing protein [Persicirhabdus sediminis]